MFSQKKYNVLVTGGAGFLGKSNMSPIKRFLKYLAVISGSLMLFLIVALWILAVAFQTQVKRELTGYIRSHTGHSFFHLMRQTRINPENFLR